MVSLYPAIQKSILAAISHPHFDAALPPLSDQTWARLLSPCNNTLDENERLEFLGDALMYATIGRQLYAQIPEGSPHLYTNVRAALHSNTTFSHLAEKMDILAVSSSVLEALTIRTFGEGTSAPSKSKPQIKATADLFETVIGAYYMDHGFESLCSWVRGVYTPLIVAAKKAFDDCQAVGRIRKRPRHNTYLGDISGRLGKRPKLVKSPIKRKVLPLRSKLKAIRPAQTPEDAVRQFAATSNPEPIATCFSTDRLPVSGTTGTERRHSPEKYLTPTVIDLTLTSDSSDAEGSHATKARRAITSQPRRRIPSHRARKPAMITIDPTSKNGVDVGPEEDDSSSNDEFLLEQMLTVEIDINVESNGQVSSYGG